MMKEKPQERYEAITNSRRKKKKVVQKGHVNKVSHDDAGQHNYLIITTDELKHKEITK